MPDRDDAAPGDARPRDLARPGHAAARPRPVADTETMPAVRAGARPGGGRPSDPLPRKPANPPVAAPRVWPSVEKERAARRALRAEEGRRERTPGAGGSGGRGAGPAPSSGTDRPGPAGGPRRTGPRLAWLLLPVALVALALAVWWPFGGDPAGSPTAGSTPRATTTATRQAAPATPAATVQLDIRVGDENGTGRSQQLAVLVNGRTLAQGAVALPLHLTATAAPTDRLTILVPQPTRGTHLTCTVTASGSVAGAMTRQQDDGMLDCSSTVADIATGGT